MNWRVALSDLDFDDREKQAVLDVLDSRWLTMGQVTERFEDAFDEILGVKHAIAVSNATVGLHLANLAVGVGPGDEVILPSLTFVATANAILYTGAKPIFVDITSESDFSISAQAVEAAITPRTKAICVMHYGGYVCDMPVILALAEEHDLALIEDAAHAPGSKMDGHYAGTMGDVSVFSFFSSKNLAVGEGGMVTTDDDELVAQIRLMRSHGMTSLTWDRHRGHAHSYDVVALGYNYRIDEIRSALGLVQLEKLEVSNKRRREISDLYKSKLAELDGLSIPYMQHPGISAAHLFPVLLDPEVDRYTFMDAMKEQGVQTSIHYPPVHTFSYYREHFGKVSLPVTESVGSREVTLPLYSSMTDEQVEIVVQAVKKSLEE